MIPVRFIYLDDDGSELPERHYDVDCYAVPRIGEMIVPQAGSARRTGAIVVNVHHTLFTLTEHGGPVEQRIHVVLRERPSPPAP